MDGRGLRRLRPALAAVPPVAGRGRAARGLLAGEVGARGAGAGHPGPRPAARGRRGGHRGAGRRLPRSSRERRASRGAPSGELATQDYYRQLLRLVYRLIFLFVAEDRDLLLDPRSPAEAARPLRCASTRTARLRRLAERRRGDPRTPTSTGACALVMDEARRRTKAAQRLGLPALGSFLWSPRGRLAPRRLRTRQPRPPGRRPRARLHRGARPGADASWTTATSARRSWAASTSPSWSCTRDIDTRRRHLRAARGARAASARPPAATTRPTSLIQCLLDSALDPVLDEAASKPRPRAAPSWP